MKTIAVLLVLYVGNSMAWLTHEQQAELKRFSEECSYQMNITIDKVHKALMGDADEDKDKLECYAECLLQKGNIMDKDGNINDAALREKMPKDLSREQVDHVVKECQHIDADNGCKKAAKFAKCVIKSITVLELSSD